MKTAEEVAREIPIWTDANPPKEEYIQEIAQALTQYAEERVKEVMGNKLNKWPSALKAMEP